MEIKMNEKTECKRKNLGMTLQWSMVLILGLVLASFNFDTKSSAEKFLYKTEPVGQEKEVYFVVEEMPSFQGKGLQGFRTWVQKNVQYPRGAEERGVQGRVFVQFIVTDQGDVVDAKVTKSIDPDLDKESVRVVMSSPKWTPGKQKGQYVNVRFTLPISFALGTE